VGPERGPLTLVSTTEELLGRNSSDSGLENLDYGRRDPLCRQCDTVYPQKLALTSPTSGCSSVGIVRSRTEAKGYTFSFEICHFIRNKRPANSESIRTLRVVMRQKCC
jgi:hypothetical protein